MGLGRTETGAADIVLHSVQHQSWSQLMSWRAKVAEAASGLSGRYPLQLNPVMGRRCGTEVWQLWPSSRHDQGEKKATDVGTTSTNPSPTIMVELGRGSWDPSGIAVQLATFAYKKAVPATHRSGAPLPATTHHGGGTLRRRPPGHREDTHLLREYGVFSMGVGVGGSWKFQ